MALEEPELRAMFSGVANAYGTHRPALCEAIVRTTGPILELGMGDSSTPSLHALAEATGRSVCSFDHDASWVSRYADLGSDHHRIERVSSWDECPIESTRWGVAFVDHAPGNRRIVDIERLAKQADVVVVHDTDDQTYGYDRVFGSFAHRLDYRGDKPWTTLLSNYVDVAQWVIRGDGLVPTAPRQLRTSVLVPCAAQHVERLPELLAALRAQTRQADEIIVALSGCSRAELPTIVTKLVSEVVTGDGIIYQDASVSGCSRVELPTIGAKITLSVEPRTAGANRNRATAVATGDVLIYQDADDLPHPQRVEIIARLFEAYAIDHLMHFFYYLKEDVPTQSTQFSVEQAAANTAYYGKLMREVRYRTGLVEYVTNGNVAVLRSVAQGVPWPEHPRTGEDQEFNRAIYARSKRTVVTPLPLIIYRHNYSTFC